MTVHRVPSSLHTAFLRQIKNSGYDSDDEVDDACVERNIDASFQYVQYDVPVGVHEDTVYIEVQAVKQVAENRHDDDKYKKLEAGWKIVNAPSCPGDS